MSFSPGIFRKWRWLRVAMAYLRSSAQAPISRSSKGIDALLRRFGINFAGQFRRVGGDRIYCDTGFQIVEEHAAGLAAFGSGSAINAVRQFGHADRAQCRLAFTDPFGNDSEEPRHVKALPLCLDHDAGIEDHSKVAGAHGLLRS